MRYDGSLTTSVLIEFLVRLIQNAPKKIFLILDDVSVLHSSQVDAWLATHSEEIEGFILTPDACELVPDETLNCESKADTDSESSTNDRSKLLVHMESSLREFLKMPNRARIYFRYLTITYAP